LDFADRLLPVDNKNSFIFSTAALTGEEKREKDHLTLREKLESKGYRIVDPFINHLKSSESTIDIG